MDKNDEIKLSDIITKLQPPYRILEEGELYLCGLTYHGLDAPANEEIVMVGEIKRGNV